MKKLLILAVAFLALAACNKQDPQSSSQAQLDPTAVSFDAYLNRAVTKSGAAGDITTATLQTNGFGVFAYYTDNNTYDDQATPNFMYNQQVTYAASKWSYTPVKYWPNEYGTNAISDDVDKVSFFAYTPYVAVTPSTGKVADASFGITGMNRNSANGDPILKYVVSLDPAKSVDLCWGVIGADEDVTNWKLVQTNAAQTGLTVGLPWKDVQRPLDPTDGQLLKFTFKHALSKLNVQIDADVDGTDETNALAANTKIYVRSITFTGFAMKGALNLNNGTPNKAEWLDYAGTNDLVTGDELTIYDGRKDGKEGVAGAVASNEKTLGLNPVIISNDGNSTAGVTNVPVNLFGKTDPATGDAVAIGDTESVYVIPTGDAITVIIDYDVETIDANLPSLISDGTNYGSSINNVIRKTVTFGSDTHFENGKAYKLTLHLGMNSVKFTADVTGWTAANDDADVNLPGNTYVPIP